MNDSIDASLLREVLASLPAARFSFAYGSGAIPQNGVISRNRMLDFVVAVDRAEQWHRENMVVRGNSFHYSNLMRFLGPQAVASVQQSALGARVYYNTLVPWKNGRVFKYGVITFSDLMEDLKEWQTLYVSGRMHKPIKIIKADKDIETANERNIENAACAALLTLPERFDETKFYERVASLSYLGDPRLSVRAEDPNKICKIVSSNREAFRRLYAPALQRLKTVVYWDSSGSGATQDMQADAREALLKRLPGTFVHKMHAVLAEKELQHTTRSRRLLRSTTVMKRLVARAVAAKGNEYCQKALTGALCQTVRQSSTAQMLKGVLTAGVVRSTKYALSKLQKGAFFVKV
uniref:Phosphatidate cytidylyltransferase, mitochondrial n=1 Tax=Rhodosorus marinus TaxID=101924 RepID=A0A7S3E5Y9_9RHOD|mmetsp:Transcript_11460/g.47685  ORF Transcript_11460/g.47685 Transcript_11460/m.47685 type:complete len:349 (+) Transcript_11460:309-1355(+)